MAQGRGHFQTFQRRPPSIIPPASKFTTTTISMACELQEFGGFLEGISHFPEQLTLYQSRLKEILRPRMDSSLGIDYGTNSVRALIVDCSNGAELGSCVVDYPSGHQGVPLDRTNHHLARHAIWGASDHRAHRGVCRASGERRRRGWHRREERPCDADLRGYHGLHNSYSCLQSGLCAWSSRFCRSHRRDPQRFPSRSSGHDVTEGCRINTPQPGKSKGLPRARQALPLAA